MADEANIPFDGISASGTGSRFRGAGGEHQGVWPRRVGWPIRAGRATSR